MLMKKIQFLILSILSASILNVVAQDIPARPNPPKLVNDLAGILSSEEVSTLERKLVNIDDTTSVQIAVVIVKDLQGADPNQFAFQIGQTWGVGQKGKNNGVVILVKPKTSDSRGQVAIQNGYGMEAFMTDALSKRIIENEIIPQFKQNNYYQGIDAAINAIVLASKGAYKGEGRAKNTKSGSGLAFLIIIGIILFFIFISKNNKSKHHTIGRNSNLPFWLLMGGMMGSSGKSSGSGWGDFSSGSGGFGGFGGGSFGGGGASGSW
jgi:uncharacterized protein